MFYNGPCGKFGSNTNDERILKRIEWNVTDYKMKIKEPYSLVPFLNMRVDYAHKEPRHIP